MFQILLLLLLKTAYPSPEVDIFNDVIYPALLGVPNVTEAGYLKFGCDGTGTSGGLCSLSNSSFCVPMPLFCDPNFQIIQHIILVGSVAADLANLGFEGIPTHFNGTFPTELALLTSLKTLEISDYSLSGVLPASGVQIPALEKILLKGNRLSGIIPNLQNLSNLTQLDLSGNLFSSSLPMLPDSLNIVLLQNNELHGVLPSQWADLATFRKLSLQNNFLEGTVPPAYSSWTSVREIQLQNNRFSGSIPSALNWQLDTFVIVQNRFSGALPELVTNSSSTSCYLAVNSAEEQNCFQCPLPPIMEFKCNVSHPVWFLNSSVMCEPACYPFPFVQTPAEEPAQSPATEEPSALSAASPEVSPAYSPAFSPSAGLPIPSPNQEDHSLIIAILAVAGILVLIFAGSGVVLLTKLRKRGASQRAQSGGDLSSSTEDASKRSSKRRHSRRQSVQHPSRSKNTSRRQSRAVNNALAHFSNYSSVPSLPTANNSSAVSLVSSVESDNYEKFGTGVWFRRKQQLMGSSAGSSAFSDYGSLPAVPPFSSGAYSNAISSMYGSLPGPSSAAPSSADVYAGLAFAAVAELKKSELVVNDEEEITRFEKIGSGFFGFVFRGTFRGVEVAIKEVGAFLSGKALSRARKDFLEEARAMASIPAHPNVLPLIAVCAADPVLLIVPFMKCGSLKEMLYGEDRKSLITLLSADVAHLLLIGIADGLSHLHQCNVIHRDVAARNVLVGDDGRPLLSDFGMSRILKSDAHKTKTKLAPLRWLSPEALGSKVYSEKSDVWAFACLAVEICDRRQPWSTFGNIVAARKIHDREKPPVVNAGPELLQLLSRCWSYDAEQRPTMRETLQALCAMKVHDVMCVSMYAPISDEAEEMQATVGVDYVEPD